MAVIFPPFRNVESVGTQTNLIRLQEISETARQVAQHIYPQADSVAFKSKEAELSAWMTHYARDGTRPNKDPVLRIDNDLLIYHGASDELRLKFLRLCGYVYNSYSTDLVPIENNAT